MHFTVDSIADNLYLKLHDDLFDLICTSDGSQAREKGASLTRELLDEIIALEADVRDRVPVVSPAELPPGLRECFTDRPIAQTDSNASELNDTHEAGDAEGAHPAEDEESDHQVPRGGMGRLHGLLNVQGYGLDASEMSGARRGLQQQAQKKRSRRPGTSQTPKPAPLSTETVVRDSAAIRRKFKETFDPDFFPRSYQVTELYLPRTIYEKHSLRYQAKKRIRADRDTLSGLIVTLRKDPPPWAFA
eukprot:Gregarina_sp_Pseudo_9__2183@NODE_252_length_3415_cov_19_956161_g235_i0_p3_GENE_NODE_252_length_3415_cov_19_956161_g235_i0NODE_252_length_3415_cov_19_956161_g235_i0_p3_ORF_typecomplete_len246_score5_13_NODE_252_length_3415_cov_19_956161_g235_i02651002